MRSIAWILVFAIYAYGATVPRLFGQNPEGVELHSHADVNIASVAQGYVPATSTSAVPFSVKLMSENDDPHHDDDEDESCPEELVPVNRTDGFDLWGDKSYSAYGDFIYPNANAKYPVALHLDTVDGNLVVDHFTTFHRFFRALRESSISLRIGAGFLSFNTSSFCTIEDWANAYALARPFTDGVEHNSNVGKYVKYYGRSKDHHSDTKTISFELHKIVKGRYKGFIKYWLFAFEYPCSTQLFIWDFKCFVKGRPDPALFEKPAFIPDGQLPKYRSFAAASATCTAVPLPPLP